MIPLRMIILNKNLTVVELFPNNGCPGTSDDVVVTSELVGLPPGVLGAESMLGSIFFFSPGGWTVVVEEDEKRDCVGTRADVWNVCGTGSMEPNVFDVGGVGSGTTDKTFIV